MIRSTMPCCDFVADIIAEAANRHFISAENLAAVRDANFQHGFPFGFLRLQGMATVNFWLQKMQPVNLLTAENLAAAKDVKRQFGFRSESSCCRIVNLVSAEILARGCKKCKPSTWFPLGALRSQRIEIGKLVSARSLAAAEDANRRPGYRRESRACKRCNQSTSKIASPNISRLQQIAYS